MAIKRLTELFQRSLEHTWYKWSPLWDMAILVTFVDAPWVIANSVGEKSVCIFTMPSWYYGQLQEGPGSGSVQWENRQLPTSRPPNHLSGEDRVGYW